jgi:hypothetical protein
MWSFGIVIVELLQDGVKPYPKLKTNAEVSGYTLAGNVHLKPAECDTDERLAALFSVSEVCFARDPNARPSFSSVAEELERLRSKYLDEVAQLSVGFSLAENNAETGSRSSPTGGGTAECSIEAGSLTFSTGVANHTYEYLLDSPKPCRAGSAHRHNYGTAVRVSSTSTLPGGVEGGSRESVEINQYPMVTHV